MPSASSTNVKVEKQIQDNALADNSTPLRQAITIIEHKIRNLEKRKSKLESYKELQNAGKTLNEDQKTAVAKFNEVIQTLDFARDLCKQFIGIVAVTEKDAKKQAKREAAVKNQAELARLREILLVQDALNQMGNETVREDFLHGRNGAAQLSESDLKLLDEVYPAVTPKHEEGNPTAFTNEVQAAAEHLLAVVDGKQKEVFGGTYCQIKEILGKIHESGYFDQTEVKTYVEPETLEQQEVPIETVNAPETLPSQPDIAHQLPIESLAIDPLQPSLHGTNVPIQPTMEQPQQQPPPAPVLEQIVPPENMFHQAPPVVPQQPPRPITEMLETGSFYFLQESEIEPEQIPSQTFTNQNFVSGMHLPPPIPLPPQHFQPQMANNIVNNLANNIPNNLPPNVNNLNNIQPQPQAPTQNQQVPLGIQKNGNLLPEEREQKYTEDSHNKVLSQNNINKYQNRNNQPSYYQNNGYNKESYNNKDYKDNYNRPRQNRNNGNSRSQHRH